MISINLDDPNLEENFRSLQEVQKTGMFTDEQLQEMYDRQVEKDKKQLEEKGENELKPCPFCGSKKIHIYGMLNIVECKECRASISAKFTVGEAVKAWNRRAENV